MAKINLRPWREELRKERQNEYIAVLGFVVMAALAIWWLVSGAYQSAIDGQEFRNSYLENQGKALDVKIKEISELRKKRTQLLDRMKLIQDLQGNRPVIVRVFDEMARVVPEELFLESVEVKDQSFEIDGRASSNEQISELMRRFDASEWFTSPNLIAVKAIKGSYNSFEMTVKQTSPVVEEAK